MIGCILREKIVSQTRKYQFFNKEFTSCGGYLSFQRAVIPVRRSISILNN